MFLYRIKAGCEVSLFFFCTQSTSLLFQSVSENLDFAYFVASDT